MLRARQAITDAQGGFEFMGLPAGSYRVTVSPGQYSAQYVTAAYGASGSTGSFMPDSGQPIQLADGQVFDKALVALPRGGVISGRVTDENAEPLARVQVSTLFLPPGSTRGQRLGQSIQTDDLGQFRLFGLRTGDYLVVAEARSSNFVPPNALPQSEAERLGFITTYYPGASDEAGAQRVRSRAGAETSGIEIRLAQGRLFRISGTITDSQGRILPRVNGQLTSRGSGVMSGFGFAADEQGRFQMRNLPPGNYRLVVRQTRQDLERAGPGQQADPVEMAVLPLTIADDVENLVVMTGPGTTITGQIVFEQGAPSPIPAQMGVMASAGNPDDGAGLPSPQPAMVTPDLAFTMKGLMGEYLLRANAGNQYVKSVTANGDDITDTPHEFKASDRVVITVTSRVSTLEGSVTDAKGAPSQDSAVMMFSEDKGSWRQGSTRTKRGLVDAEGHFRITGLMPGRYFIVAMSRARLSLPFGAEAGFFEPLSKEATAVVIGEDEQRKIDLKVSEGSGGQ